MMMITQMVKISLFVLAGMISGGSAIDCSKFKDENSCNSHTFPGGIFRPCWWNPFKGMCLPRHSARATEASASSFVSMEADVDGDYLDLEDYAATSSAHDDDIYFFDDNLFEPDDNVDASGSNDNDASDIKKYLRAN
jgi:hypothetical protein